MKKLIISCLAVLAAFQIVPAQDRSEIKAEVKEQRRALMLERQSQPQDQTPNAKAATAAAVTAADVGEPDSFGKNAQFLGTASAGVILIDPTCDPNDIGQLGPDDRCVSPDANGNIPSQTFNDIGRITIPGKSVSNIIYAIANHTVNFDLFNPNANPVQGRVSYVPSVTIESEALNDPTLIDPTTNLPYNGSFTTTGLGTFSRNQTVQSGANSLETASYTRANTIGFSRTFFAGLGLPNNVINQLYKKPMTIRLNVRISASHVDFGTMLYSIRFLGN